MGETRTVFDRHRSQWLSVNGKVFRYSNIVMWQYPKLHEGLREDLTFARHRVESPRETPWIAKLTAAT